MENRAGSLVTTDALHDEVSKYMTKAYLTIVEQEETEEGTLFVASHPELMGCVAQGATAQEALNDLKEARYDYISLLVESGIEVPVPEYEKNQRQFQVTTLSTNQNPVVTADKVPVLA